MGKIGEARSQRERRDVVGALLVAGVAGVEPNADRDG